MTNIEVIFKDFEDWQLMLALPAIDALLGQGWDVHFLTKQASLIPELKKMAPQIHLHQSAENLNKEWISIVPYDLKRQSRPAGRQLFFPVIPEQEAKKYVAFKKDLRFLPLASQAQLGYRTADVASLIDLILHLNHIHPLQGKRVLITGGPTAEDIDPVRFITNRSSGKMGLALARAAFISGAEARFVLGASSLPVPEYLTYTRVRSAGEMAEAVFEQFDDCHFYIGAAAIADFKPAQTSPNKIKKSGQSQTLQLELVRTTDVLAELNRRKKRQKLIGFSVETENEIENSRQKLLRKGLDCIIINNPKDTGAAFGQETNKVSVLTQSGRLLKWPLMTKLELSLKIMELLAELEKES